MKINAWPRPYRTWFFAVLALFWLYGLTYSIRQGGEPNPSIDSTSEQINVWGAKKFVENGFFSHHLLPLYPPFGEGIDGKPRQKPFIYNHYIAGADLTLALWLKTFGMNAVGSARMIPHTLTVLALGLLGLGFATLIQSPLMGCLLTTLLMVPRSLTVWSTHLYGHSYATAVLFALLGSIALIIAKAAKNTRYKPTKAAAVVGLAGGFLSPIYALDWSFLNFIALGAFLLLFSKDHRRISLPAILAMACGGLLAGAYQIFISILEFGSLGAVIEDARQWLLLKNGAVENQAHYIDHKLSAVLREFNRQSYGSTGMTAGNLITVSMMYVLMTLAAKIINVKRALTITLAVTLAYLAAASWSIIMKSHCMGNLHYTVRHYLVLFLFTLFVSLPLGRELVLRARTAKRAKC